MRIGRKVRRYPVEDHTDTGLVQRIDEGLEIVRCAVARTRCKVSSGLITPGTIERMLHDGQKLDVGETQLPRIRRQLPCRRPIVEPLAVAAPAPRAEVYLVDRDRRGERVAGRAHAHP